MARQRGRPGVVDVLQEHAAEGGVPGALSLGRRDLVAEVPDRGPPAVAGDELVLAVDPAHRRRLEESLFPDGLGEISDPGVVVAFDLEGAVVERVEGEVENRSGIGRGGSDGSLGSSGGEGWGCRDDVLHSRLLGFRGERWCRPGRRRARCILDADDAFAPAPRRLTKN